MYTVSHTQITEPMKTVVISTKIYWNYKLQAGRAFKEWHCELTLKSETLKTQNSQFSTVSTGKCQIFNLNRFAWKET